MRRTKTMLMGDLLEEFFKRPYVAADIIVYGISDRSAEKPSDKSTYLGSYACPVFPAHILHRTASCQNRQRYDRIQNSVFHTLQF